MNLLSKSHDSLSTMSCLGFSDFDEAACALVANWRFRRETAESRDKGLEVRIWV